MKYPPPPVESPLGLTPEGLITSPVWIQWFNLLSPVEQSMELALNVPPIVQTSQTTRPTGEDKTDEIETLALFNVVQDQTTKLTGDSKTDDIETLTLLSNMPEQTSAERYMRNDNNPANITDPAYGADRLGILDSTIAIRKAVATGRPVYAPTGTYKVSDRIVFVTEGQRFYGDGPGFMETAASASWNCATRILATGTFAKQLMTRRKASTIASPDTDDTMSCVLELENDKICIANMMIDLYCDYTDASPTNLGDNCDAAIFIGTRLECVVENVNIRGYFRKAGIYADQTRSEDIPEFSHSSVGTYPVSLGGAGLDRTKIWSCSIMGSHKGIFIAGAINVGTGNDYYDEPTLTEYTAEGGRGGVGASDFLLGGNSNICSRDHHSGYRGYDPTMNPDTDDIDALTACFAVDARRGSSTQGRVRRIHIGADVRMRTFEACRIFLGRVYEVKIDWLHTEPTPTSVMPTVYNTSGVAITRNDYTPTGTAYGPIAAVTTSGAYDGADHVHIDGIAGTGPVADWFQDRVTTYSIRNNILNGDVLGDLEVQGDLLVDGDADITGSADITGDLDVTGNVGVTGTLDVTGDAGFDGAVEFSGAVSFAGSGAITAPNIPLRYDYSSANDLDPDTAVIIDLGGADFTGIGLLSSNSKTRPQILFAFRSASTNSFIQAIGTYVGAVGFYDDTVLEGTTGIDDQVNLGTSNANPGKIYIENRLTTAVTLNVWILT